MLWIETDDLCKSLGYPGTLVPINSFSRIEIEGGQLKGFYADGERKPAVIANSTLYEMEGLFSELRIMQHGLREAIERGDTFYCPHKYCDAHREEVIADMQQEEEMLGRKNRRKKASK